MMRWHVREAFSIAGWLARRIREGRTVLVTCQQGRNRSGLVTALTLVALTGASGNRCARAVKARRHSPYGEALCNRDFLDLLRSIPSKRSAGPVTQDAALQAGLAY
jgi:protein-tyrosine phosphatase